MESTVSRRITKEVRGSTDTFGNTWWKGEGEPCPQRFVWFGILTQRQWKLFYTENAYIEVISKGHIHKHLCKTHPFWSVTISDLSQSSKTKKISERDCELKHIYEVTYVEQVSRLKTITQPWSRHNMCQSITNIISSTSAWIKALSAAGDWKSKN